MKSTRRSDSRLLALFGVLALLPLAIWACTSAGDGPGAPTGPPTVYNPGMDQTGATIDVVVTNPMVEAGDTIGILATFKDANRNPVQGVPLGVWPEAGEAAAPYFTYHTNPTLTDANGQASIHIVVDANCPEDSYTFVIATFPAGPINGPQARGYAYVVVGSAGYIQSLTLTGPAVITVGEVETFYATAVVGNGCDPRYQFRVNNFSWDPPTPTPTNVYRYRFPAGGSHAIQARARCLGQGDSGWVYSNILLYQ